MGQCGQARQGRLRGADGGEPELDVPSSQAARRSRAGDLLPGLLGDGPERREHGDVQVDGPGADRAAAGHGDAREAEAGDERAEDEETGAGQADLRGRGGGGGQACRERGEGGRKEGATKGGGGSGPSAHRGGVRRRREGAGGVDDDDGPVGGVGPADVRANRAEDVEHRADVCDVRHAPQRDGRAAEEARGEQGQDGVLAAADLGEAAEPRDPFDLRTEHRRRAQSELYSRLAAP